MTLEITALSSLRDTVRDWRAAGQRVALVPTMGALHAGHFSLVEHAKTLANRVVVSIFVNPTQFGPNEDFSKYPRTLADDLAGLREAGADAAWLPDVATMYPDGFASSIRIGGVTEMMDGLARPGHFDGVATVVAKLLNQVQPDVALFGEKDYQQLCLIKRLIIDLNMHLSVVGVPTMREADGLALSSRNRYLSESERKIAPELHHTLQQVASLLREGIPPATALSGGIQHLVGVGFTVDYLELRDANTLQSLSEYKAQGRLLVAARLGTTRLIDNINIE